MATRREVRDERVHDESARDPAQPVPEQARADDDAGAVGDHQIRLAGDAGDLAVAPREHHELGIRRDDEGPLAAVEAPEDHVGRAGEIDAIEGDPQNIHALPATTAGHPAFHALTLVDGDEAPPEEVEVLERQAGALRDAVQRVLGDVAGHPRDLRHELVHVAQEGAAADRTMPLSMTSEASSGGVCSRTLFTAVMIC